MNAPFRASTLEVLLSFNLRRRLTRLMVGFALLFFVGCNNAPPPKTAKAAKVEVATPITDIVMDYQDFTGRLEAMKAVEIRARVSGYIREIPFKEGDLVKENDLLFQIDERPYAADLHQAEANVRVAVAERNLMEKNADRARKLLQTKSIGREEYDATVGRV